MEGPAQLGLQVIRMVEAGSLKRSALPLLCTQLLHRVSAHSSPVCAMLCQQTATECLLWPSAATMALSCRPLPYMELPDAPLAAAHCLVHVGSHGPNSQQQDQQQGTSGPLCTPASKFIHHFCILRAPLYILLHECLDQELYSPVFS